MDATGNRGLVSRIWMPDFLCKKAYERLQFGVGLLFDKDFLENDIVRTILYNRITMYKSALIVLETSAEPITLAWYRNTFGEDWNGNSVRLKGEIDRLINRYKELEKKKKATEKTFEDVVGGVETLLGHAIDRRITVFEFKTLYDNALKRAKA